MEYLKYEHDRIRNPSMCMCMCVRNGTTQLLVGITRFLAEKYISIRRWLLSIGLVREKSWVYFFNKISIILRNFPKYGSYNLYKMEIFLTQKYQRSLKIFQNYGHLKLVPNPMTWGLPQVTTQSYDYLSTHCAQVNWQIIQICAWENLHVSAD